MNVRNTLLCRVETATQVLMRLSRRKRHRERAKVYYYLYCRCVNLDPFDERADLSRFRNFRMIQKPSHQPRNEIV